MLLHSQMHKEFVECESMQTHTFVSMSFFTMSFVATNALYTKWLNFVSWKCFD